MAQSPYENMKNQDLVELVEQRDRQLEQLQLELAGLNREPLLFPNGDVVTAESIHELWGALEKPTARPAFTRPDAYTLLFGERTTGHRQVTVARVPGQLCSELAKLHHWVAVNVSRDGGVNVKDWIIRTAAWRAGIVMMRTAPGIVGLHKRLASESDESIESALLYVMGEHLRSLLGWRE